MNQRRRKRIKRKRRRFLKLTLAVFLLIVISAGSYGAYLTYKLANATSEVNEELERGAKSEKRLVDVDPKKDNFSVLFAGIDERPKETYSRTDALLLTTFNKEEKIYVHC